MESFDYAPKDLNKAIKRHHFHLPTADEILASMSNARFFTKLNFSSAYWLEQKIEVDDESSKLEHSIRNQLSQRDLQS